MHHEIDSKIEEIAEICRRYGVERLDVFGSAARGIDFDPENSDVDFLVEFQETLPDKILRCWKGLRTDLADALGREVDLVSMGGVRNKVLQAHIDASRETVFDIALSLPSGADAHFSRIREPVLDSET